jgi:hypothetical protein
MLFWGLIKGVFDVKFNFRELKSILNKNFLKKRRAE